MSASASHKGVVLRRHGSSSTSLFLGLLCYNRCRWHYSNSPAANKVGGWWNKPLASAPGYKRERRGCSRSRARLQRMKCPAQAYSETVQSQRLSASARVRSCDFLARTLLLRSSDLSERNGNGVAFCEGPKAATIARMRALAHDLPTGT
jgi:hypothetical protein